jgi:hypothetical protein
MKIKIQNRYGRNPLQVNPHSIVKKIYKMTNLCAEILKPDYETIIFPKILPKNFKYKGKNYIHHAAEKKDLSMLDNAINGKHNLSLKDNFGNNAIYYLFQDKKSDSGEFELIDANFLHKILVADRKTWNISNTYDLFSYFRKKIISIIHSKKEFIYDEEKYEKIISTYRQCIGTIKELNLKLEISATDFKNLVFNSSIQAVLLEDALLATKEKEEAIERLINTINMFNTPIPEKIEPKQPLSFISTIDDLGFYNHQAIVGTSGNGKSVYLAQQMLNGFIIDVNADQDAIYEMFKNHILKHENFKNVVMSDRLFHLLEQNASFIARKMLKEELDNELTNTKIERKKFKI